MSRVKLPEFPISKLEKTRLKKKYVKILGATEGVDDSMIGESIANYLIPEIDYKGMVCLDLGANIGAFTQIALDAGASKVCTVECDARNFAKLESTYKNDDYVDLVYAAVSGLPDKTLKIFKSASQNAHCSTSIESKMKFSEYDEVENIHLKKLLKKYNPDIIKMDIESAEYTLIDTLLDYEPKYLFIELHAGKHRAEMYQVLERLQSIYPHSRVVPLIIFTDNLIAHDCFFKK
jgi:FkbM family methyltransferase